MINASEKYIIGVDITESEVLVLTIARENGNHLDYIQSVTGDDAINLYKILTNGVDKKKVLIERYGVAHCPRCIGDVHGMGRIQFCPNCGQGLIWPGSLSEIERFVERNPYIKSDECKELIKDLEKDKINRSTKIKLFMDPSIYERDEYRSKAYLPNNKVSYIEPYDETKYGPKPSR